MNILLLKGYNNYFNRIMKKEDSLADYKTAVNKYYDYASVNFNPNDGITTELVIGNNGKDGQTEPGLVPTPLEWENTGCPDYLIAYEMVSNSPVIRSRWFIMESERTRNGQYRIALKRDLLADYDSEILNSPCYVEKGTIRDKSNPLLFNAEGMSFNQIKKNEIFLKDETKCAWLVGYIKKDMTSTPSGFPISYTSDSDIIGRKIVDVTGKPWADCIKYFSNGAQEQGTGSKTCMKINNSNSAGKFNMYFDDHDYLEQGNAQIAITIQRSQKIEWDFNLNMKSPVANASAGAQTNAMKITPDEAPWNVVEAFNRIFGVELQTTANASWNSLLADTKSTYGNYVFTEDDIATICQDGYILKSNKLYKLSVSAPTSTTLTQQYDGNSAVSNALLNSLATSVAVSNKTWTAARTTNDLQKKRMVVSMVGNTYEITATEVILSETVQYTIPLPSARATVNDAQYDIFAMPVSPEVLGMSVPITEVNIYNNGTKIINVGSCSETQLGVATLISTALGAGTGAGYGYDLQLLPYCPYDFSNSVTVGSDGVVTIDIKDLTANYDYTILTDSAQTPNNRGIIFYPRKSNFSKNIPLILENVHEEYDNLVVDAPKLIFTGSYDEDNYPIYSYYFPNKCSDSYNDINWNELVMPPSIRGSLMGVGGFLLNNGYPGFYVSLQIPLNPPAPYITLTGEQTSLRAHWIHEDNAEYLKIANECDFQRIVSPNFNGMFEFKKSKMSDGIHYVNVDCTYKPYNPYIKLNPDFSGLYGQDWNDSTGLICGGDFSIPMISDAMVNYELGNKNYQAIFARQIQNLDVNNQLLKEQQAYFASIGHVTAFATGAAAGAKLGGGIGEMAGGAKGRAIGAAAGAYYGGVLTTINSFKGAAKDEEWLQRSQSEARSFAVDNYTYQLGNIQALPQTITKSSPLSFNNKIWPILEEFSCTDEEKEVLKNKLKYDGMTIMAVGKLLDYAEDGKYLKGKLIRLPDLKDDFHVADAIYQVVDRGFYKGE